MSKWTHLDTEESIERELRALREQTTQIRDTDDPLVVLIRGTILMERALHYMLDDYLVEGLKPFTTYRPTFAFLTDLARAVGLLTANEKALIDDVRSLRNDVAHRIDAVVTENDEKVLVAKFLSHGYTIEVQDKGVIHLLIKALNPKAFDASRVFYKLRFIILFLVALLNHRNGERSTFRIETHTPRTDEDTLRGLNLFAAFLMTGFEFSESTKQDRDKLLMQFAKIEFTLRQRRKGDAKTPALMQPQTQAQLTPDTAEE